MVKWLSRLSLGVVSIGVAVLAGGAAQAEGDGGAVETNSVRIVLDLGSAIVLGSGCPSGRADVTLTPYAGGFRMNFVRPTRIDLPRGAATLADSATCSVRIPITIPAGYRVSEVRPTLAYQVNKTARSSVTGMLQLTLPGAQVLPPLAVEAPSGQAVRRTIAGSSRYVVPYSPDQCGATGLLGVSASLSGRKDDASQGLTATMGAVTLRPGYELILSPC